MELLLKEDVMVETKHAKSRSCHPKTNESPIVSHIVWLHLAKHLHA